MSSNASRLLRQFGSVFKLILDGKRDPDRIGMMLHKIIVNPSPEKPSKLEDDSDSGVIFKQLATIFKLLVDEKRDRGLVTVLLQEIIDGRCPTIGGLINEGSDTRSYLNSLDVCLGWLLMPIKSVGFKQDLLQRLQNAGVRYYGDLLAMSEEDFVRIVNVPVRERELLYGMLARQKILLGSFNSTLGRLAYQELRKEKQRSEKRVAEMKARQAALNPTEEEFNRTYLVGKTGNTVRVKCKYCGDIFSYDFEGIFRVDCCQCGQRRPGAGTPAPAFPKSESRYHGEAPNSEW